MPYPAHKTLYALRRPISACHQARQFITVNQTVSEPSWGRNSYHRPTRQVRLVKPLTRNSTPTGRKVKMQTCDDALRKDFPCSYNAISAPVAERRTFAQQIELVGRLPQNTETAITHRRADLPRSVIFPLNHPRGFTKRQRRWSARSCDCSSTYRIAGWRVSAA